MRLLIAWIMLAASVAPALAGMTVSFDWGPTKKCFDAKSPLMTFSGVPDGTKTLDIRMIDLNAPNYPHGGAKVAYSGQEALAYGAFRYKGPCPPAPHFYQFTVKALDANGQTIAKATARRKFP